LLTAAFSINFVLEVTEICANGYWHLLPIWFSVLIRPHPAIWRLVHGMAVVYLVSLTFLLFQVSKVFFLILFKKPLIATRLFRFVNLSKALLIYGAKVSFSFLLTTRNSILLVLRLSFLHKINKSVIALIKKKSIAWQSEHLAEHVESIRCASAKYATTWCKIHICLRK
jgi:hypothetical protein